MDLIVGNDIHHIQNASISKTGNGLRIRRMGSHPLNIPLSDPEQAYDRVCKGLGKGEVIDLSDLVPNAEKETVVEEATDDTKTDDSGKETA